jgi:hypothetical protein
MHETLVAKVHADVGHLPLNIEEQQVTRLEITATHCIHSGPQLPGRPGNLDPGLGIGILHQAAAVETAWRTAPVTIRHTNLVEGNSRRTFTDAQPLHRFGHRCIGAAAG